jgi:hypothetical protein
LRDRKPAGWYIAPPDILLYTIFEIDDTIIRNGVFVKNTVFTKKPQRNLVYFQERNTKKGRYRKFLSYISYNSADVWIENGVNSVLSTPNTG